MYTPGDSVDVLIAMVPAALKMNLADLKTNGILIVNLMTRWKHLRKAQITVSPLEVHSLDGYRLFAVQLTKPRARAERCQPRCEEHGPL